MIDIQLECHNAIGISIINLETLYDQIKRANELKVIKARMSVFDKPWYKRKWS